MGAGEGSGGWEDIESELGEVTSMRVGESLEAACTVGEWEKVEGVDVDQLGVLRSRSKQQQEEERREKFGRETNDEGDGGAVREWEELKVNERRRTGVYGESERGFVLVRVVRE